MQDIESMGRVKCPRCESVNTKFCYYNNYNLSQPRHFCKGCRRYWTRGGVLRNVPVGGGCRKTKRSSNPKPLSSTTATPPDLSKSTSHSHSSSEGSSITAVSEPQVLTTNDPIVNNVGDSSQLRMREEQQKMMIVDCEEDDKIQEMLELAGDGGFGSLDWATLPNTYWSHTQWNDPTLFLP